MKPDPYLSRFTRRLFAGMLCLLSVAPSAVSAFNDDEPMGWAPAYSGEQDVWQEQEGELPAYPVKARLLEVDAGTEGLQYTMYLDEASLVKGDDGVVRYTVVLVSSTGVWNVTHEGLHCGERTYRRYAYGIDGKWQRLIDSSWVPLRGKGANHYRLVFYEKYICDPTRLNQSARQILDRFRGSWHEQM
jgi:hypothetical protein